MITKSNSVPKRKINQFVYRDEGRPELAELVANERKRKAELPD